MPVTEAAVEKTKAFWRKRLSVDLTTEQAEDIITTISSLFILLDQWDNKEAVDAMRDGGAE